MNSMKDMNVEIGEVDVFDDSKKENVIDATIVETADGKDGEKTEKVEKTEEKKKKGSSTSKKNLNRLVKDIEKQNTELLRLELDFIRAVIEVMGPVSRLKHDILTSYIIFIHVHVLTKTCLSPNCKINPTSGPRKWYQRSTYWQCCKWRSRCSRWITKKSPRPSPIPHPRYYGLF